jgi:hypothetical protein
MNGKAGPMLGQYLLAKLVLFAERNSLHACRFQAYGESANAREQVKNPHS